MANDLTVLMPRILARSLRVMREHCWMPRLVNSNFDNKATEKGKTIDVPISVAATVSDVTPGNTPPQAPDTTPTMVQVPLDQWKHSSFFLTDEDMVNIDRSREFLPMQTQESVKALANHINQYLWGLYKRVGGFVGTPGTTPFASSTQAAIDARRVLHEQLCPKSGRSGVVDFEAEAAMLALAAFQDVDKAGDRGVKMEGEVGRKFGIDWLSDDHVPQHTAGTSSGHQVNAGGGLPAGTTVIPVDTGTGTILEGDVVTFAGHDQTYAVEEALSGSSFTIVGGLKDAVADNATVTVKASHRVNMVFHREAFAFAMRPLRDASRGADLGAQIMSMRDPQTGLVLRLEISRQYKQVMWDLDVLFGGKIVRPDFATRIAG